MTPREGVTVGSARIAEPTATTERPVQLVTAFCSACRKPGAHAATLDQTGDAVLRCPTDGCGHGFKVPRAALTSRASLAKYLDDHAANVEHHVSAAEEAAEQEKRDVEFAKLFQ